ncbi:mRNA decay protein [Lecanora helva]
MHRHSFKVLTLLANFFFLCTIASPSILRSLDNAPVLHFTLTRRGGQFAPQEFGRDHANLSYLAEELKRAESRFNLTQRQFSGNKLVRKAKSAADGGKGEGMLMSEVSNDGIWYTKFNIGSPPQEIEVDLNMLVSDFYVMTTTSRIGSKYDDYFSQSVIKSLDRPYPICSEPTDVFHLPTVNTSIPLSFAYCRPLKFSLQTLGASGSTLGLAPSEHLGQIRSASFLKQLLDKDAIQRSVFSLMLINGQDGVLSLGGTAAGAVALVESQTKSQLDSLGGGENEDLKPAEQLQPLKKRGRTSKGITVREPEWDDGWTWSDVQGAEGWWQVLMDGVWVDGSKVLKNQAVVIDMNSPFILAPPLAAKAFYASVSGSRPLPAPFSNFYVFPCLNPPHLHFEFGGKTFPFMQGGRGAEWSGIPGGKFSLGRLEAGSGYCIGAVVETRMGIKEERDEIVHDGKRGSSTTSRGGLGGNGMRDVWVIGEGFFRGVGGVFDFRERRSLDSSLKKNTAFIKRLRTAITASGSATFLQEIQSLSLHKYLSEVISASYEGLCRLKTSGEIAAGVVVISALHQRFGPSEYTSYLGWLLGRGLSTPDKSQLKGLTQEAREKEEKDRLTRQRVLLKVVTELWLVGFLRSLDDVARPDDVTARGKEIAGPSAAGKTKSVQGASKSDRSADAEPFPLEVLKDLLGHDKEHANLPLVVLFVKSFAWDVLGIRSTGAERQKSVKADGAIVEAREPYEQSSTDEDSVAKVDDPPLTSPELQQRFKNVINRYFEDVKLHIIRDNKTITVQGRRNAEAYVKSGEVFEDRQAHYDKQLKSQEKLIANAQVLCDALENQEMPDLKEKDASDTTAYPGIGLIKTGEYLRGQTDGAGIWEDDEERRFYENLVDLQDRVPGVLLEDGKKKKSEGEEQIGKRTEGQSEGKDSTEKPTQSTGSDDQSTAIANKTVGAQVDALLARLPELQNKEQIDQAAMDFCFLNSKASRNRLIKAVQDVPKGRSDLLPSYSRLVATLGKYLPDISHALVSYLDEEFRSLQRRKQKDFLGQVRTGNIRYLAELTKFGVVPEHIIFHCLKVSLDDFSRMNIEIIGNLLENCGRYLLRNPDTSPRMNSFLETLQRKKGAQHLGQQERMLIENAMYYVSPPERAAIEQKERTPVELYVSRLIYLDMNKRTYTKVLKSLRKLHWEETEVVDLLEKIFSKPGKVKYSNIHLLAVLLGSLYRYHQDFVIMVIDNLLENVTVGLEQNDFKFNQRRLAEVKYLGELYNYKMVDSPVIFDTLYRIVTFGHPGGTPTQDRLNPLDLPDDYFRVRLVCTILDTCGVCFDRGQAKKKLDFFLTFFQYYIRTKATLPMDIDFMIQDTFATIRPQMKLTTSLEEAASNFANLVKQNYKSQEPEKPLETEDPDEGVSSDDEADDDEPQIPDVDDRSSSDEAEVETEALTNNQSKNDSDFEEEIIVTRQEEEHDPEAEAEFDRELAKMMSESLDSRKFDRRPIFDVPLPMRKALRETSSVPIEDSGNEGTSTPPKTNTMAFSLMTKKGNRQQTRTIEMPSDSHFAVAMKTQKEAERAEQQRIKDLVLSYDPDSSTDQAGKENDLYFDYFSQTNPNLPQQKAGFPNLAPNQEITLAHTSMSKGLGGEKHGFSHHQHNASLQQSSPNNVNARPADRSGANRGGHRARKLQLSDVDWYGQKSDPSRVQGRKVSHRGSHNRTRKVVG